MYINKVRSKLENFGVDSHDFSIIDHNDCKVLDSTSPLNVEVGPDTFSATNVANAVKGTGTAIVDGISSAAEGVGKIYNKLASNSNWEAAMVSSHPNAN